MRGAYETEVRDCPYCGFLTDADYVDVGIGLVQCGPFYCVQCRASEIGPHDESRELTEEEKKTGWYAPATPVGSSVNTFRGVPVSHKVAKKLYVMGILDNRLETKEIN